MFDYSSIRTVSGKFQNSGNLFLLQTLMKRFSNDYSTCIILVTSRLIFSWFLKLKCFFFCFFLLFRRSTCNMVLITLDILNEMLNGIYELVCNLPILVCKIDICQEIGCLLLATCWHY